MVNTASTPPSACSFPARVSRMYTGSCTSTPAPIIQNQLIASMTPGRPGSARPWRRMRAVSRSGFQDTARPGRPGACAGTKRLQA